MFTCFIPLNFILFIVYVPLLYICVLHWVFKVAQYSTYADILELKPIGDDTHPTTVFLTYVYYVKVQTWDKAYLTSFLIVYKFLNFCKRDKSTVHASKIKLLLP